MDELVGNVQMIGIKRRASDKNGLADLQIKTTKENNSVKKGRAGLAQKNE